MITYSFSRSVALDKVRNKTYVNFMVFSGIEYVDGKVHWQLKKPLVKGASYREWL